MTDLEVCPSCGSFTDYLGEVTGWCHECEAINGTADAKACLGCGVWKTLEDFPTHRRSQDGHRGKCRTCTSARRTVNARTRTGGATTTARLLGGSRRRRDGALRRLRSEAAAWEAVVGVVRSMPGQG
jgi:hypothetical protein